MDPIREWLRRVWYLLNRSRFDEALRQEMEAHRAEMGAPARFGNTLRLREEAQDVWGWGWLDALRRDVAVSGRTLRRSPTFAFVAILTLAVGVGVNLAFFQVVKAVLLQPPAVPSPESLARFNRVCCGSDRSSVSSLVPQPVADFVRQHSTVLSAVLTRNQMDLAWGPDGVERVRAAFVSTNWFDELGATAAAGRLFEADRATSASDPVAVLSYELWQSRLAGREDVVGQRIYLNDRPVTVVGVASAGFVGLDADVPGVWLPIEQIGTLFGLQRTAEADWQRGVQLFGRFAPGVSASAVEDGLRAALVELSRARPDEIEAGEGLEPLLASEHFMDPFERRQAFTMAAAAGALALLVLLISALNLGNLMLARAISRVREMSIRSALGARRWHVMRSLALDGILLAAGGGLVGLWLALGAGPLMTRLAGLPPGLDLSPDWRTALMLFGMITAAGMVVSVPAAWRVGRRDLAPAVRDGGERATASLHALRLRSALVALQLAGCAVLLVFAGQMLRGLDRLSPRHLGFEFEQVAVLQPSLSEYGMTAGAAVGYWSDIKARISGHPDVEHAALVSLPPLGQAISTSSFAIAPHLTISRLAVEPEFFSTMRIPILSGRSFSPHDTPGAVIIVSRTVALEMYGRADVVGEGFPRGDRQSTIVGVAGDARVFTPHATNAGQAYGLLAPSSAVQAVLLARARTDVSPLPAVLRQTSRDVAPHISPAVRLVRADYAARSHGPRVAASLAGATALLALALACVGVTGVVSYVAGLRTKEIGVRMALGATSGSILRTLLGASAAAGALGTALGLAGGWMVARVLAGRPLYVDPVDPLPYAAAALTLALSACLAAFWPAVRLFREDPLKALRFE